MIAVIGNRLNRTSFLLMKYEWNRDESILSESVDLSFKGLNWWNKGMLLMSTFAMEITIELAIGLSRLVYGLLSEK